MKFLSRIAPVAVCLVSLSLIGAGCSGSVNDDVSPSEEGAVDNSVNLTSITRQDALNKYWYYIAPYIKGTESVQAYSAQSGSTYTVDADLSGGFVDSIDDGQGDQLNFTAELKADGTASGDDQFGNNWEFTIDLANSPIIADAVAEWAAATGHKIEN